MLNRKVLLIALLAVVLLGSFMEGTVGVDGLRRRKPKMVETAPGAVAAVDLNFYRASLTNLMNQITTGVAGVDPNDLQASLKGRKPHRSRASIDEGGLNQLTFTDNLKRRRGRPRASFDPAGLNQLAGGIAGIDPTKG